MRLQRSLSERGPVVGEGRDLGTVVFPDAAVKVYLDADPRTRATRRALELERRGLAVPLERVLEELEQRDRRDRTRADSPLRAAEGAVVIESSGLGPGAVVGEVLRAVRAHPGCPAPPGEGAGRDSRPGD